MFIKVLRYICEEFDNVQLPSLLKDGLAYKCFSKYLKFLRTPF